MADQVKMNLSLDFRIISAILAVVILAMLALWRPWSPQYDEHARTVSVTGEATVKAAPDEYAFWPSYKFDNTDKAIAISDAAKKTNEVSMKLKELGVKDSDIKTDVNGYNTPQDVSGSSHDLYTYTASVNATVNDKDLAQKVQDYLISTHPDGSVTPQPTFSAVKRKELESQARELAIKDARTKADQAAKNLGFSIATVKSVNDGVGFGGITPVFNDVKTSGAADLPISSVVLQPGENDLNYSVSVEYFIR